MLSERWWPAVGDTLQGLWTHEGDRSAQIAVVLTGRDRIHALNRDFREKDRPTDVLTFDLSDSSDRVEDEIYLSVPVATDQAHDAGVSLDEELSRLVIHGFLHLAGYDHHTPLDGRKMAAATRRWLADIHHVA